MKPESHLFADIPLSDGKSFKDYLIYDGMYYWWYNELAIIVDLNLSDYRGLNKLKSIQLLITKYCRFLLCLIDIVIYIAFLVINRISKHQFPVDNHSDKILIQFKNDSIRWKYIYDEKSMKFNINSTDYTEIIHRLSDKYYPEIIFDDLPIPTTINHYLKVALHYSGPLNTLMRHWSLNIWRKEKASIDYFKDVYEKLIDDTQWLIECSKLTGLSVSQFKKKLEYHCLCSFPLCVRHYELMKYSVRNNRPDLFFLTCENAYLGRGWTYIAHESHIPIIALQHGLFPPDNLAYTTHSINDIELKNNMAYPIPDMTLVWGKYDYDVLTINAGYPKEKVKIVGNPNYDRLVNLPSHYSRDTFCQKYGIDSTKKLILWASQSHGFEVEINKRYASSIFKTISELDDVILIIKPHPWENEKHKNLMKEELKKYNIIVYFMSTDSDTTEAIYISDLVIIQNSTVGQEVIALDKPLICLDYSTTPDPVNYAKDGVAEGVYNPKDLKNTIVSLLNDDTQQKLARNAYISKYLYKMDGKAAERCISVIESMTKIK